jgi:hypothetical protein
VLFRSNRFRAAVASNLNALASLGSPVDVINAVLKQFSATFELQGQRAPAATMPYSCVVTVETFSSQLLNRQRVFSTVKDEGDNDANFIWNNLGVLITPDDYDGELKSLDRGFFWCTPTHVLEAVCDRYNPNRDRAATTVRTRLGLHRMLRGQRLLRIDIPPAALAGKGMRAPTVFDGGSNPFFMPCARGDGYGRTLNLRRVSRDMRELVVEKIPFTRDFVVERMGEVYANVPRPDFNRLELRIDQF